MFVTIVLLLVLSALVLADDIKPYKPNAKVCGNPGQSCGGLMDRVLSSPTDLFFYVDDDAYNTTYYSAPFYAVILASRKAVISESDDETCGGYFTSSQVAAAQKRFPKRKVFASRRCFGHPVGYTNVNPQYNFLAVYAGYTKAQAKKVMAKAKEHKAWKTANLRQMQVEFFHGCMAKMPENELRFCLAD